MQSFPKPLTHEEESYYLDRFKAGDLEAKTILVEKNLRLVAHIVKKYSHFGPDTEELISIGIVGLVKAINTFNADKGRIATYAARCIENELLMRFRTERKLSKEVSLYEPIGTDKEGNEISLLDIIEDQSVDVVERITFRENTKKMYTYIRECLTPREQEILLLRYGLCQAAPVTQREIATRLGISRSYVSRLEKKALGKLRVAFEKNGDPK